MHHSLKARFFECLCKNTAFKARLKPNFYCFCNGFKSQLFRFALGGEVERWTNSDPSIHIQAQIHLKVDTNFYFILHWFLLYLTGNET